MVGLLDQPPADERHKFGESDQLLAADVFNEAELWRPVLDPVMTRLSLKVRWWQLGRDDDISFVGYPDLAGKIREIKGQLERFGQEIHLGLGWRWLNESPMGKQQPWDFLSYTVDSPQFNQELLPLTQDELVANLAGMKDQQARRWVILNPLSSKHYEVEERARDLVGRMLAAKMQHADCVFIPNPFDDERGLMNADGTPGELLLPWRTTALMISGSEYLGSINLPNGSRNYILSRGDEAVMVVWNETPIKESIYLGENVKQIDLWGRVKDPQIDKAEHGGSRQVIDVGPLPMFITGINQALARTRMGFSFDKTQLSSVFGRRQTAKFRLKNFFSQSLGGQMKIDPPLGWSIEPASRRLKLAAGEDLLESFQVLLTDANSGEQKLRVDFNISADRDYKFSVYRTVDVGLGDVIIELSTQLNEKGELLVQQHLINKSDKFVSFNCRLSAPNRRRMRKQVFNLSRGRNTRVYDLPRGEELIGKTLGLRAEEINGERILNYRFTAKP